MTKAEFTEKCTSHRSMLRLMPALVFQQKTQSIPKVTSGGTRSTQLLAMCSGSLENITTYLPGSQGDQTRVFAKRTFLHLAHKLGQLSECGCSSRSAMRKNKGKTRRTWKPIPYLWPILQGSSQALQQGSPCSSLQKHKGRHVFECSLRTVEAKSTTFVFPSAFAFVSI